MGKRAVKKTAAAAGEGDASNESDGAIEMEVGTEAPKVMRRHAAAVGKNKKSFSIERSRSQVLVRTGKKGKGGSFSIRYGIHHGIDFGTLEAAADRAKKMFE